MVYKLHRIGVQTAQKKVYKLPQLGVHNTQNSEYRVHRTRSTKYTEEGVQSTDMCQMYL